MIHISVVNRSTLFPDAELPATCNGLQIHFTRDFFPLWGKEVRIYYTPSGKNPTADHWVIGIYDDPDVANALGDHDLTPAGAPLGKVFVRPTLADGLTVSSVICHEGDEMGIDPWIDDQVQVDSLEYAKEIDDAVENDSYDIVIPAGWAGAGQKITMSNFVTENWFHKTAPPPYDFLGKLTKPLELSPGGYIGYRDLNNLQAGWQQFTNRTDPKAIMQARPHEGSRRLLRTIPQNQRVRSTYAPGSEAVPCEVAA